MIPGLYARSSLLLPIAILGVASAGVDPAQGQVLINELDGRSAARTNPTAADEIGDFVELSGSAGTSLDGYSVMLINGAGDLVVRSYDLSGFKIAAGKSLFVAGSYGTPNADLVMHSPGSQAEPFEIGSDGVAIFFSGTNPPVNPPGPGIMVTAGNLPAANLSDAAVYSSGPVQDASLPGILTPGNNQVIERIAAGSVADAAAQSASRSSDGGTARTTGNYSPLRTTPGHPNPGQTGAASRFLSVTYGTPATTTAATITEAAGATHTLSVTITATPAPAATLTVTLKNRDVSEVEMPATVDIPPSGSVTFTVTAVDDGWRDGDQWAYFWASAPDSFSTAGWVKAQDNGTAPATAPTLVINEVHAHLFDNANGQGATDGDDQFVEILNTGSAKVDLSNYKLVSSSGAANQFVFPNGAILPAGAAFVVFRGGVTPGTSSNFGTARVFTGLPALEENGDVVRLLNAANAEVADFVYWPFAGGSNTRNDAGVLQTIGHSVIAPGKKSSPGTKPDGTPIFTAGTVALQLPATIREDAALGAVSLQVGVTGGPAGPNDLLLTSSSPGLVFDNGLTQKTVTVTAGTPLAVAMTPVRDANTTDDPVSISSVGAGFVDAASASVNVTDTGRNSLVINEVFAGSPGKDQFIEILNISSAPVALDGYTVFKSGTGTPIFTFPDTTPDSSIIFPGQAIVVVGSDSDATSGSVAGQYGTAFVFKAGAPLNLTAAADLVQLKNGADEVAGMTVFGYGAGSNNLSDADHVFQTSNAAPGPGFKLDGTTPWSTAAPALTIEYSQPSSSELELRGVVKLKVKRAAATPNPAVVLLNATAGVNLAGTIVTIPANATESPQVDMDPVRDDASNTADATVTVTTVSSGYLNGSDNSFIVKDSDVPARLKIDLSATSIAGHTGPNAVAAQLTISPSAAQNRLVRLRLQKPLPETVPGTATSGGLTLVAPTVTQPGNTVSIPASGTTTAFNVKSGPQTVPGETYELVAIVDGTNESASATITVGADGNVFINEVAAGTQGEGREFVELYTTGAAQSLDGLRLVFYDGTGAIAAQQALTGSSSANRYVIGDAGVPAFNSEPASFTIPASGAVALYRSNAAVTPGADNLLDVFVYGSFSNADLLKKLLPTISGGVWNAGTIFTPPGAGVQSSRRTAIPVPDTLRQGAASWESSPYATPGLPDNASAYEVWTRRYAFPDPAAANQSLDADPDGDGIKNGIEFALGLNPVVANWGVLPQPVIGPGNTISITYNISALAAADATSTPPHAVGTAPHFTIIIETGNTGLSWTNSNATLPAGGGAMTTSAAPSNRLFYRLNVQQ